MGDFKVVDKTGEWLINRGVFPMAQPAGHRFMPGQPTKIDLDEWIKGQMVAKVLAECADPLASARPKDVAGPVAKAASSPGVKA